MSTAALLLLTLSAIAHAAWNIFGKRAADSGIAYYLLATLAAALLMLPVLGRLGDWLGELPSDYWLLVALTGCAQTIYFVGLWGTYRYGALGLGYPIVRALPVLLVPLGSAIWLHNAPPLMVSVGMLIIVIAMLGLIHSHGAVRQTRAILFAVLAACGTVGYSLIDYQALHLMQVWLPHTAKWQLMLLYASCQSWSIVLCLCTILLFPSQRLQLKAINRKGAISAMLAGCIMLLTYALVLQSYMLVSSASYVVAFRQLSIPIGVCFAVFFLHEPISYRAVIANITLLGGLLLVVVYS
jgi:drug/metabolite transporter (DMT)-like permease